MDEQTTRAAAGAAAAGLVSGLLLGAQARRRHPGLLPWHRTTVLGVPVGRRQGWAGTARALGHGARQLGVATRKASGTAEDIHELREQLDTMNRRSPVEIVLDGLTHRRGAHRRES